MKHSAPTRRIPLGVKLGGLSALLLVLMAVVSAIAVVSLGNVAKGSDKLYEQGVTPMASLSDVRATINLNRLFASKYQQQTTDDGRSENMAIIQDNRKIIDTALASLSGQLSAPAERTAYNELRAAYKAYIPVVNHSMALAAQGKDTLEYSTNVSTPAGNKVSDALTGLQKTIATTADAQRDDAHSTFTSARTMLLILLAVALILGASLSFLLVRSIRRGVVAVVERLDSLKNHDTADLRKGLDRMAEGDLTEPIAASTAPIEKWSRDEIGDIAQAVNAVRDNTVASVDAYNSTRGALGEMIGEVSTVAGTVASSTQQMAATSEEAGRAVGEIAHAVTDVASGAERQVRMVEDARHASQETAEAAAEAHSLASGGTQAAEKASAAMESVRASSGEAAAAIQALAAKSDEIGGIVSTISGIAEQTNLLALNAAIEAARAGEQGRGFAVVAEEVRKLAEESSSAAATISGLIEQIQAETQTAVSVVEEGASRSEDGAAVVAEARNSFDQIAQAIDRVRMSVDRIAEATTEVAAVAEQSSASTEEVSASTEQTSASAQQIAASAQQLAHTAEELDRLVGRFTLAR
jgi:methyl-accepting chemotaxis protein